MLLRAILPFLRYSHLCNFDDSLCYSRFYLNNRRGVYSVPFQGLMVLYV